MRLQDIDNIFCTHIFIIIPMSILGTTILVSPWAPKISGPALQAAAALPEAQSWRGGAVQTVWREFDLGKEIKAEKEMKQLANGAEEAS